MLCYTHLSFYKLGIKNYAQLCGGVKMWPFSYLFRLHGVLFDTVFGGFDLYATRPKVELNCMEQYRIYLIYN